MTTFNLADLQSKSTDDLRRIARQQVRNGDLLLAEKLANAGETIGHWIACAGQPALISAIMSKLASDKIISRGDSPDGGSPQPDDNGIPSPQPMPIPEHGVKSPQPQPDNAPEPDGGDNGGNGANQPPPLESIIRHIANDEANAVYNIRIGEMSKVAGDMSAELLSTIETMIGAKSRPDELIIKRPELPDIKIKHPHYLLASVVKFLTARRLDGYRLNLLLLGAAGTGKSTLAKQAAEVLGLEFFSKSCSEDMPVSDLVGYMNAGGIYTPAIMRAPYERGGLFLLDEIDASNANVLVAMNSALDNGVCSFPDGMVKRHMENAFVATANTWSGATAEYVGRTKPDSALKNRFEIIKVDYDRDLERQLSRDQAWLEYVWLARDAADKHGIKHIISTRQILSGDALLAVGFKRREVEQMALWKDLADDETRMIKSTIKECQKTGAPVVMPDAPEVELI